MSSNKDMELFKVMEDSLKRYLKAAGLISQEAFDLLSKHNGLLWMEISEQREILEGITREDKKEESVAKKEEPVAKKEEPVAKKEEPAAKKEESVAKKEETLTEKEKTNIEEEENEPSVKENGPIKLYDRIVAFLKNQKCDELQWVRTYSIKWAYEDFEDFQIKYFEHKDITQESKNYILFGDTKKHYSIRKAGSDVVGDTAECFDIILNLSKVLNIDSVTA